MRTQKFFMVKPGRVIATTMWLSVALAGMPHFVSSARAQNADALVGAIRPLSLRQKWTPGQQLSYGVSLSGTMSAQASPHSKSFLAGVPMDIEVRLEGDTTLDTLSVDELGTGTVAMRVQNLRLRAETFGQKGEFSVRDGKALMTLNGQRLGGNRPLDAKAFSEPEWAFQISDRGRLKGAVPIKTGAPKTPANAPANATNEKRSGLPFDPAAFAQSMFLRVIPNLWPQTDVKTGEKWSAEVLWPGDELARIAAAKSGRPQSETKEPPLSLGKIDFTLMGEEEVAGRKAVRIAVDGGFTVDETKAKSMQQSVEQLADSKEADRKAVAPNGKAADTKTARDRQWKSNLERAEQKVSGNVWFDPQAGHVVRAELQLSTQASARDVAFKENAKPNNAAPKAPKVVDADSWLDFSGTLQLQLKNVQQKNIVAQPATAALDGNA